ncbi:MAG: DUF5615 family PIN-like protein [Candidatus Latescibacterota bacterium]
MLCWTPSSPAARILTWRSCGATDADLWRFARLHGFTIVSKDNDFRQRAFLFGAPPRAIWVCVGNAGTQAIADLLRANRTRISQFSQAEGEGLLILELQRSD